MSLEKYEIKLFTLTCITNLHVGYGDDAYGYIDKRIQRSPINGEPIIHSSSLKGALREYYEQDYPNDISDSNQDEKNGKADSFIRHVFGSEFRREADGSG